jgi:pyroglutamyl-peptidase
MPRVLLTAFKPYDRWQVNASWLAVMELTKETPTEVDLTTRLYPVDYLEMRKQLEKDLADGYDFAIHVGQAPGTSVVRLEAIGLNAMGPICEKSNQLPPLDPEGPLAVKTDLPLAAWAKLLREKQIPAEVSYHAGTYLCNAALYHSLRISRQQNLPTRSVFVHIPLDVPQAIAEPQSCPALPAALSAQAIRWVLGQLLYL